MQESLKPQKMAFEDTSPIKYLKSYLKKEKNA